MIPLRLQHFAAIDLFLDLAFLITRVGTRFGQKIAKITFLIVVSLIVRKTC